jgi:hypothetical protein
MSKIVIALPSLYGGFSVWTLTPLQVIKDKDCFRLICAEWGQRQHDNSPDTGFVSSNAKQTLM